MIDAHLFQVVQAVASLLSGAIVICALIVLWTKTPSGWLLFALAGEAISMLFRLVFALMPGMLISAPTISLVWQATGLMMAAGLLGYALERPGRRE